MSACGRSGRIARRQTGSPRRSDHSTPSISRRGHFVTNDLAKEKFSRAASIEAGKRSSPISPRAMHRDDPLVDLYRRLIRDEIFGLIEEHFRSDCVPGSILSGGRRRESATIAGVASRRRRQPWRSSRRRWRAGQRRSAGTMFSTFTALIHRLRGFAGREPHFLYCYDDFLSPLVRFDRCELLPVDDGPYSWNRIRYLLSPDGYSGSASGRRRRVRCRPRCDEPCASGMLELARGRGCRLWERDPVCWTTTAASG